jgi:uncharacterized coiled-coil protein SlyX
MTHDPNDINIENLARIAERRINLIHELFIKIDKLESQITRQNITLKEMCSRMLTIDNNRENLRNHNRILTYKIKDLENEIRTRLKQ